LSVQVKAQPEAATRTRTGAYALSVLAAPLNAYILRTLATGPASLAELRQAAGGPPQTTVRKHLAALVDKGIITRERKRNFGGNVSYELQKSGRDLLGTAGVVNAWLAESPSGLLELGTIAAKSAIKALVDGWSTSLLRALAARPLTLTQLDALISGVSYPSLERRLVAMRMARQVQPAWSEGRGTPYAVTDWLRSSAGPLVSAACWERTHLPKQTAPIGRIDIEAAFLLAMPLLKLDSSATGVCRLGVETVNSQRRIVGVLVGIEEGDVTYCRARLEGVAAARVTGSINAWFRALGRGTVNDLEIDGDGELARAVVDGLHARLVKVASSSDR